jgi:long-subunit fatty acid transport protein
MQGYWGFSLGTDYEFAKKIKATDITLVESYTGSGLSEDVKDTIALDTVSGHISLPWKIGAGFSVLYKSQWLFAADYSRQDWSAFEYFGAGAGLAKQVQYSFGVQYNYNAKERENLLKMMWYRAGLRYASTPLLVKNQQLTEYGITFGVGVPIGEKTKGSFNLSLETGIRGENKNNLVAERFTNITFGFSFTPSYYDRWFAKPKID